MLKPEEIASIGEAVSRHAVTSTDQRLVCTMSMVCKDWRVALQDKAPAGLLDVSLEVGNRWAPNDAGMPSASMLKLASFSQWLPQYAKLVRKLEGSWYQNEDDKNRTWFKALAETVFTLALRSAAAACIGNSAQQQMQPLGLQSYSSYAPISSAVLQSLPVASLTELRIQWSNESALAAALPRLTKLQRLEIHGYDDRNKPMAAVFQAAQQLSTLTELSFTQKYISSSEVKLVSPHLVRLVLCVSGSDVADFSHITRLTSLRIRSGPSVGYKFPAQLVELSVADGGDSQQDDSPSVVSISNISSLKCLESLQIKISRENAEDLLQLVALPKLHKLSLDCFDTQRTLAASAAWPKLRQLQDVYLELGSCSSSACMQLFRNLGKITWLTELGAYIELDDDAEQQAVPIAICGEICKLKSLQGLYLHVAGASNRLQQSSWASDDLALLSNLTQLTKLHLRAYDFGDEVINDATVVGLLLKLKQLQNLSVPVKSAAVFPVIAELSNLAELNLANPPEAVQRSGLRYLQGMKSLTVLEGFEQCSKQALADFWAAVRA